MDFLREGLRLPFEKFPYSYRSRSTALQQVRCLATGLHLNTFAAAINLRGLAEDQFHAILAAPLRTCSKNFEPRNAGEKLGLGKGGSPRKEVMQIGNVIAWDTARHDMILLDMIT